MTQKITVTPDSKKAVLPEKCAGVLFSWISFNRILLLLLLLAGIVWYGFYATHTKEIPGSDDREYVSIARNIVSGKGIVRNFIYPVEINFFEKFPIPEFVHPPGYPLILAGFFKLFGISDFSALLPSYLSYFMLILVFFFFVKRDLEIQTAVIATVILIFNKDILNLSLVALSEAVYILVFFLFLVLMVKASSLRDIFISGILLGVSHLIRENIYPYLFPLFLYLYFYPDLPRTKKMVLFIAGFLIPNLFNIMRSFLETGSPFFSYGKFVLMTYTDQYPWVNIFREIQVPSFKLIQFLLKYLDNSVVAWGGILSISNPYLWALFLMEMFYWNTNAQWKKAKILTLFLLISQILFVPLITFNSRYFIPFLPMVIILGSQSFARMHRDLVSKVKVHWKNAIRCMMILWFIIFFILPSTYLMVRRSGSLMPGFQAPQFGFLIPTREAEKLNEFLRRELKENQVIWTDLPEILEWEGDRLCGWLPTRIEMIYRIHQKIPVDAILLTNLRTPRQMEEEWRYLLFSEHSLPLYRTVRLYKEGRLFAKLLIRDEKE